MGRYYVYAFMRESGSPYYIGKGTGRRAYQRGKGAGRPVGEPPRDRVRILCDNLSEEEALFLEELLISKYKRISEGGILHNKSAGGEKGFTGLTHTPETIQILKEKRATQTLTPERNRRVSEGLKQAYKDGRRKREVSQATRDKISANSANSKSITIDNKNFTSLTECAKHYGVSVPAVRRWIKRGGKPTKLRKYPYHTKW